MGGSKFIIHSTLYTGTGYDDLHPRVTDRHGDAATCRPDARKGIHVGGISEWIPYRKLVYP